MFNMKFHADERSMDMTRRRRWHRKMIPDRANANENLLRQTTEETLIDTDVVFRMQTTQTSPSDPATQNNKDIKIELSAPRMFLSFKSKPSSSPTRRDQSVILERRLEAYYYELRAYIYQARHLLAMDYDNFSGRRSRRAGSFCENIPIRSVCTNWIHQSKSTDRSDSEDALSELG